MLYTWFDNKILCIIQGVSRSVCNNLPAGSTIKNNVSVL